MLALQDLRLGHCLDTVFQESVRAGVEYFACNGCCEADWEQVYKLSVQHPQVIPNFGLHPWWVGQRSNNWLEALRQRLISCPTAGLGECGLDQGRKGSAVDIDEQANVLVQQLRLGKELQRPVSVHCVQAFGKLQSIVQEEGPFPHGLILHSCKGNAELVKQLAKVQGVYFSLSGHTMSMSSKKLSSMLHMVPLERLLLETDAPDGLLENGDPDLILVPASPEAQAPQERLNHPANIRSILKVVAATKQIDSFTIAAAAFSNASSLFLKSAG